MNRGRWLFRYPGDDSVMAAMPPETPEKVAMAKMSALIRRGLVTGCTCGCRGDFEITDKGAAFIESFRAEQDIKKKRSH